ncbi:MAG: sugar ABC transporter substrate-binding protein [Miltoncostaeaceae bacterium]
MKSRFRNAAAIALTAAVATTFVACGGSSDSSASGSSTSSSANASATKIAAYDGVEAKLPTSFKEPTKKAGYTFVVGYPNPSAAVPALKAQQDAVQAEVEKLGGKLITTDANLSVQKQVSDFQQLLGQNVDAIILSALDPNSLTPLLKKAEAQGVKVYANDVPYKAGLPAIPGFSSTSLTGTDQAGYARAKYVAENYPGAKFALLGVGIPAPMLDYMVSSVKDWGTKFGLKYVDRVDAPTDSPEAATKAASAILAKDKDVKVIFAATDSEALGAAQAVKQSGRTDVIVIGNGGYKQGIEAVKKGALAATFWENSRDLHKQLVWAAYNDLTKQNQPQAKQIVLGDGVLVTKDNADQIANPVG